MSGAWKRLIETAWSALKAVLEKVDPREAAEIAGAYKRKYERERALRHQKSPEVATAEEEVSDGRDINNPFV